MTVIGAAIKYFSSRWQQITIKRESQLLTIFAWVLLNTCEDTSGVFN